jgi:tRNA (guanine-N7-)-methyltransferase
LPVQPSNRNCSRSVTSNQAGPHEQLEKVVRRHLETPFKRPYPQHALESFEAIAESVDQHAGPLIFDSYCGIGESTAAIARQHPQALVIGIDKSLARLDKHAPAQQQGELENYRLLRADVDDFWRLAVDAGWKLDQHFLLYPNPWPKSSHFKRRVHGSPLFPSLLALGGRLELRSNWPIYVEEFALAANIAGHASKVQTIAPSAPITPFERKYQQSGQVLWQCICEVN